MRVSTLGGMLANRLRRAEIYSKAEYWDQKAVEHDGHSVSMWPNNHLNELYHAEQMEVIDRLLPDLEGKRVLDIGCGTGRMTRYAVDRGAIAKGIDFAAATIEIAKRTSDGVNPTYGVQSIFDLDDVAQYDVLLAWGVLTVAAKNAPELRDALARLHRALRPGGTILLLEPVHRGFLHRVLDMGIPEFTGHMTSAGFDVTEVVDMHFWPARLALCYVEVPRTLTRTVYRVGQQVMHRLWKRSGDYKAIRGIRRA
jgi:SAM-dependent methyltransferase